MEASFKKASDVVATLFNRRQGGEETHTLEAPEPALPKDWPEKLPFRKRPKPYSRAIGWTPHQESPQPESQEFELFVAQSVLTEVRQHLITATTGEPYGFLIGQIVYCPWAETPYIVIDSIRRETDNLPPANDMDRFRHAWVAATRDARHRRGEVVGWYHRHGVLGLRLSEWDLHLQEEFFPEPWHCALVVASSSRGIIGGFIQRSRRAKLFRKGLAPFQELVDLDAKLVDGLKPSVVDWENYGASEAVSVIRAKWPSPATRLKKWKTKQHGDEATLPTQGESVVPPKNQRLKGSLGGRSWRPLKAREEPPRPAASSASSASVTEDDFTSAVGPIQPVVFQSEEVPEAEIRAPSRTPPPPQKKKGRKAAPPPPEEDQPEVEAAAEEVAEDAPPAKKKAAGGESAAKKSTAKKPPAKTGGKATKKPTKADSEFLDAVWGPPPFDAEEGEAQVVDDSAAAAEADAGEVEQVGKSRFEFVPNFEPEPPEVDRPGSMEWLLGLLGETLASKQVPDPEGKRERAPLAVPTPSRPRQTYVASSHNPDVDPEAQIPVLMFADEKDPALSPRQKQLGVAALAVVSLAIVVQLIMGLFGSQAPPPVPVDAQPITVTASPTQEFVELVDDFLTALQAFREGLVAFRLDQSDCAALSSELVTVAATHLPLASYVESNPDLSDRFETLDNEFQATLRRFEGTNCPIPPELTAGAGTTPPGDASGS